jgi:UMF1 family MFS transporter
LALLLVGMRKDPTGADVPSGPIRNSALLVSAWYLVFSAPLFFVTRDRPRNRKPLLQAMRDAITQLKDSLRDVRGYRGVVRFLIAHMFYNDGFATLFALGGVYAAGTFGMDEREILQFGIALNVTAGLGAFAFGWIDDWIGGKRTIVCALIGMIIPATWLLVTHQRVTFWICCLILGVFVGPVQAASRSYLSRIVPKHLQNQTFGLYSLSGKATAFIGPLLVGWITYGADSQRTGMSVIVALLSVGLLFMFAVPADPHRQTDISPMRSRLQ